MGATITLNGPVVRRGAHNVVLRDALLHSPTGRATSATDSHLVEIGVREGEYTTWIGAWDQETRQIDGGTPASILDSVRLGMRLREFQAIVIRVTTTGTPASLKGSRINFRLGRVGGRDGPATALVATDITPTDANTRTALAAVSRQINQSLSEWEESVQLIDPVELAPTGTFQGRMQVDSTTVISLQRYTGNWVEVDGAALSITSDGLSRDVANALLESNGSVGSSAPSADNLYAVYVGGDETQIRLSGTTTPTLYLGTYYLGATGGAVKWRFVGWVWVNSSTQFVDSEVSRLCCNYYNRVLKDLYRCPSYNDDDTNTTWTEGSNTWTQANSGADSQIEFLCNNEDAVVLHAQGSLESNTAGAFTYLGIGVDSITSVVRAGVHQGVDLGHIGIHYSDVLSATRHYADLMAVVSAGISTFWADDDRIGSDEDPPITYISGQVLV